MDPYNERDLKRLIEAKDYSRRKLQPFRENREEFVRQYCGSHYGDQGATDDVPVNYYELATSVYTHKLVGAPPRAYTASRTPRLKSVAQDLKLALDYSIERTYLMDTLWQVAQDAMFGIGILEVGTSESEQDSWWTDGIGEPFASWIDMDDWVHDMTAKTWDSIGFCGHKFRVPLEWARGTDLYDPDERKKLKATPVSGTNEGGDHKTSNLSGGVDSNATEFEDQTDLWQYWMPRQRQVLIVPDTEGIDAVPRPLRVVNWTGPAWGPYLTLGYNLVPGSIMPLPPAAIWKDLHDLANILYLKLGRQARAQKNILPVRGGNAEDIAAVNDTNDGQAVRVDGEIPQEISLGGPNQTNLAFFLANTELVNRHFGNLDSLGGLGASADTARQEEMLGDSASDRITFMRHRLVTLADRVMTSYAHYLYSDPTIDLELSKRIPRTDIEIPVRWNADTRQGKPDLFSIGIEPYSTVYRTPSSQARSLLEILERVVAPYAPQMIGENIETLLKILADKLDLPELEDLFFYAEFLTQPEEGNRAGKPRMPSTTTRNYVRSSGSTGTGRNNALAQALLGSMPQPAQAGQTMQGMM